MKKSKQYYRNILRGIILCVPVAISYLLLGVGILLSFMGKNLQAAVKGVWKALTTAFPVIQFETTPEDIAKQEAATREILKRRDVYLK